MRPYFSAVILLITSKHCHAAWKSVGEGKYLENPSDSDLTSYCETDCTDSSASYYEDACCTLRSAFVQEGWYDSTLAIDASVSVSCLYHCNSGTQFLRLAATGTPNHPYTAGGQEIAEQDIDVVIMLPWTENAGHAYPSGDEIEEQDVCDLTQLGTGAIGYAINGVSIFSPLSIESTDPFYPTPGLALEDLDACMGHPQATQIYHYHAFVFNDMLSEGGYDGGSCVAGWSGTPGDTTGDATIPIGNTACNDGSLNRC